MPGMKYTMVTKPKKAVAAKPKATPKPAAKKVAPKVKPKAKPKKYMDATDRPGFLFGRGTV